MESFSPLPSEVDLLAQLADIKEMEYKNMLLFTAVVDLLLEKGILRRQEVAQRVQEMDQSLASGVHLSVTQHHPRRFNRP